MNRIFNTAASADTRRPIVDFGARSPKDQQHALTRMRGSVAAANDNDAFFDDMALIESIPAWRRLSGLCQYRPGTDFEVQNRMAHTRAAQNVGEKIGRALGLSQTSLDLIKAVITAHDIAHPPLAHYGERGINNAAQKYGLQWDHDMGALRILLEWAEHDGNQGLNLTLGVIEGIAKRYWRFVDRQPQNIYERNIQELPNSIRKLDRTHNLHLDKFGPIEGQIAAIADWIAFTASDIEDGLNIGEFTLAQLREQHPFVTEIADDLVVENGGAAPSPNTLAKHVRGRLIDDVLQQTTSNIDAAIATGILKNAEDVRHLDSLLVSFSRAVEDAVTRVTQYHINIDPSHETQWHEQMVEMMFDALMNGEIALPEGWRKGFENLKGNDVNRAKLVYMHMISALSDKDVFSFIKKHRPEFYTRYEQEYESTAPLSRQVVIAPPIGALSALTRGSRGSKHSGPVEEPVR